MSQTVHMATVIVHRTPHRNWYAHVENFNSNVLEVLRLVKIHEQLTGTKPGRRSAVEILNKSGIVLLVACWEAYVEDLATTAFEFLFANASTHDVFPTRVLTLASKDLRAAPDHRRVWELAANGWRTVLQKHKSSVLADFVGKLNTPKPEQIDGLFDQLIGLSAISQTWKWKKMPPSEACKRLTELVELRGEIAHRVTTSRGVKKSDVIRAAQFIDRLAVASSNTVRQFLYDLTKKYGWGTAAYSLPPS